MADNNNNIKSARKKGFASKKWRSLKNVKLVKLQKTPWPISSTFNILIYVAGSLILNEHCFSCIWQRYISGFRRKKTICCNQLKVPYVVVVFYNKLYNKCKVKLAWKDLYHCIDRKFTLKKYKEFLHFHE